MSASIADRLAALVTSPHLFSAMLLAGLGVGLASYAVAVGQRVPEWEGRTFFAINRLPDGLRPVLWPVMQLGTLGGGLLVAAIAGLWARDIRTAVAIAVAVIAAWCAGKFVKRLVGRGRPADFFESFALREQAEGLGFVSGHTAVAFAAAAVCYPILPPSAEVVALVVAATVGVARIYFGAHLPLDVIGGAGLGVAVGVATALGAAGAAALIV